MTLVRRLFRVLVLAAAAAAALGGAAALGSTLFEAPPKNAAEFAERVAAGSERASRDGRKSKPAQRARTAAERGFARELTALCVRYEREADELGAPQGPDELADFLARALPIARRYHDEARRLDPPRSYRAELDRLLDLDRSALTTMTAMHSALLQDDLGAFEAAFAKLDVLRARSDRIFRRLGAPACASD